MALIVPEVFADAINSSLGTALRMAPLCYDALPFVPEARVYGDVVHFPKFNRVATTQNVVKGSAITSSNVDMGDTSAPIQQVASGVYVYDVEKSQIKTASLMNSMTEQITQAFAKKIDSDLIVEAVTSAIYTGTLANPNVVTFDELLEAMDAFGDSRDTESFSGILTTSKVFNSLLGMDAFISANVTVNSTVGRTNGLVQNGLVGWILGIPVYISNQAVDSDTGNSRILFIKKNSVGYVFQKNIAVEVGRDTEYLRDNIVCSGLYAVKCTSPEGVSVLA